MNKAGGYFWQLYVLIGCASLTVFWLISQLWGVPFSCPDDVSAAAGVYQYGSIWPGAKTIALQTGRFYQVIFYALTQVPYIVDDLRFTMAIRIFSSLIPFVCFPWFVREVFKNSVLAFWALLFLAVFVEASGGYNAFHALPLWFNLGLGLTLLGLGLYYRSLVLSNRQIGYLAQGIFFTALLSYEMIFVYVLVFPAIFLKWASETRCKNKGIEKLKVFFESIHLLSILMVFYLVLYVGFKAWTQATYVGTQPVAASLGDIVKTVVVFSVHGVQLEGNLGYWISTAQARHIVIAVVFFIGTVIFVRSVCKQRLVFSSWNIVVGALFVFAPNFLYALTDRYRQWAKTDPVYLGNLFSAFATALVVALVFAKLIDLLNRRLSSKIAYTIATLLLLVMSFFFSVYALAPIQRNEAYFSGLRKNMLTWKLVDRVVRSESFAEVQNGDEILSDSLLHLEFLNIDSYGYYWEAYIKKETGKTVRVLLEKQLDVASSEMAHKKYYFGTKRFDRNAVAIFGAIQDRSMILKRSSVLVLEPTNLHALNISSEAGTEHIVPLNKTEITVTVPIRADVPVNVENI